jgi:dTDP-4-amino-4,6-dideoxygalactose transaminase
MAKFSGPGGYRIGKEEKEEVMDVLSTGYLFRYGKLDDTDFKHKVYSLEQEFAKYQGVKYCVATSSGTSALLISLLALGLKPGDEVIVPGYTFVASYSAVIFAGGIPVLSEIDESLTLAPADIEKRITSRTKIIMPVHMLGNPCDMESIMGIAEKHNLAVLEDACQAGGASYRGKKVGTIGDIGAFSLNVFKTITAGDGGMIITDNRELYEKVFGIHDQGHSPNRAGVEVGKRSILGLNFRMNELTGAVALAQLRKIDYILDTLREKKRKFKEYIGQIPGMRWRKVNDKNGECATLLTAVFDSAEDAGRVADVLGTKTVDRSGWHVYYNMEHINEYLKSVGQPYGKGILPRTDDILSRSINLGVGVVDAGLGSAFGINIDADDSEIKETAGKFRECVQKNVKG